MEVNRCVSALAGPQVQRVAAYSSRTIVFTSFDPDVCRCTPAKLGAIVAVDEVASENYSCPAYLLWWCPLFGARKHHTVGVT